jgi:hypothetical protein
MAQGRRLRTATTAASRVAAARIIADAMGSAAKAKGLVAEATAKAPVAAAEITAKAMLESARTTAEATKHAAYATSLSAIFAGIGAITIAYIGLRKEEVEAKASKEQANRIKEKYEAATAALAKGENIATSAIAERDRARATVTSLEGTINTYTACVENARSKSAHVWLGGASTMAADLAECSKAAALPQLK